MKARDKNVMVGKVLLLVSNLCCTDCGVERYCRHSRAQSSRTQDLLSSVLSRARRRLVAVLNGGEREGPKKKVLTDLMEDELISKDAAIMERLQKLFRISDGTFPCLADFSDLLVPWPTYSIWLHRGCRSEDGETNRSGGAPFLPLRCWRSLRPKCEI